MGPSSVDGLSPASDVGLSCSCFEKIGVQSYTPKRVHQCLNLRPCFSCGRPPLPASQSSTTTRQATTSPSRGPPLPSSNADLSTESEATLRSSSALHSATRNLYYPFAPDSPKVTCARVPSSPYASPASSSSDASCAMRGRCSLAP